MSSRDRRERSARYRDEGRSGRDAGVPCFPEPSKYRSAEAKAAWATGWQMRDHELRHVAADKVAGRETLYEME